MYDALRRGVWLPSVVATNKRLDRKVSDSVPTLSNHYTFENLDNNMCKLMTGLHIISC